METLPFMGIKAILVMWPGRAIYVNFCLPFSTQNLTLFDRSVPEKKSFEIVDEQTMEHAYSISPHANQRPKTVESMIMKNIIVI